MTTPDFVAVIDGSTSKAARQILPDMRNGRLAMLLVDQALRQVSATATMKECCAMVTATISEAYHRHGIDPSRLIDHPKERLTASAAIFSRHCGEVWLVGDCQCLVDGAYHDNAKPEEGRIAFERSEIIHHMLATGESDIASLQRHDVGRDLIVHKIVRTCQDQNKEFAVFDGFSVATEKVKVISVPLPCEVVLSTDGYPFLLPSLHDSEAALARQLSADPLCIDSYLATKGLMAGQVSFDDRAYVRFRVIR